MEKYHKPNKRKKKKKILMVLVSSTAHHFNVRLALSCCAGQENLSLGSTVVQWPAVISPSQ